MARIIITRQLPRPEFVPLAAALAQPRTRRSGPVTVYALYQVSDGGIRYVGITRSTIAQRLKMHHQRPTNRSMRAWLRSAPRDIQIAALEEVDSSEWEDAERGWISWCRQRGRLLNVDMGGKYRDSNGKPRKIQLGEFQAPTRIRRMDGVSK